MSVLNVEDEEMLCKSTINFYCHSLIAAIGVISFFINLKYHFCLICNLLLFANKYQCHSELVILMSMVMRRVDVQEFYTSKMPYKLWNLFNKSSFHDQSKNDKLSPNTVIVKVNIYKRAR